MRCLPENPAAPVTRRRAFIETDCNGDGQRKSCPAEVSWQSVLADGPAFCQLRVDCEGIIGLCAEDKIMANNDAVYEEIMNEIGS